MALCLVLGEEVTDRFIFDISDEIYSYQRLNDEKMEIFINKSHESINVKEELECTLLDAEDSISIKIDKVPTDNHIHIMT
uniref:Uncharacterized protein n=1 Tax=Rhizophagus irregularis (strain DAOM 181602 / DAOM 197198 / MUCL 43194) TaxID=747089 RepID=U9U137_RHIID